MMNFSLLIPIIIILVIIIVVVIILLANSKKNKEEDISILDINEVGVSNDSDFSYGYEKEETIVMKPIEEEKNKSDKESEE